MEPIVIKIKIDPRKIPKGHTQHRSGSGTHKNWRKETRQKFKQKFRSNKHGE